MEPSSQLHHAKRIVRRVMGRIEADQQLAKSLQALPPRLRNLMDRIRHDHTHHGLHIRVSTKGFRVVNGNGKDLARVRLSGSGAIMVGPPHAASDREYATFISIPTALNHVYHLAWPSRHT